MLRGLLILEDNQIAFTIHGATDATITVCDGVTGIEKTISCTCDELGASLALAIASDEIGGSQDTSESLYAMAEPLQERLKLTDEEARGVKGIENTLRIIP